MKQCRVCDDYGWRWTTEWESGWYLKAESKPRVDVGYCYTKKIDCRCGQPHKAAPIVTQVIPIE